MGYAIAIFAALVAQTPAATMAASDAFVVGPPSLGSSVGHPTVEFDLANRTDKAITAWEVAVESHGADGSVEKGTMAKDAYAAYEGVIPDRGDFMRPHATIHVTVWLSDLFGTLPPSSVQRLLVSAKTVIFSDQTWAGDAAAARDMFAVRDRAYIVLTDVISVLRRARLSAPGVDALRSALSDLSKSDQVDADNPFKRTMRSNLENAIRASASDPSAADQQMRMWLTSLEARWQVTQVHRLQGPQATIK